jgi:hypothetical protein
MPGRSDGAKNPAVSGGYGVALNSDLLAILRCPACMRDADNAEQRAVRGKVALVDEAWLVCPDCRRRYPVKDDIPYMLIEEGDKNRL